MQTPPDVDVAAARAFVAVVEAGGTSSAARRLGLSKSVVSGRITALERDLGVSLFARGARLAITPRDREFYDGVGLVISDLDVLVHAASGRGDSYAGRLRIAAPAGLGRKHLGTLLCRFLAVHPDLQAEIDYADHYVDIGGGGYDLALRIGQPTNSDYVGRRLCRIRRLACASPSCLARHGAPSTVENIVPSATASSRPAVSGSSERAIPRGHAAWRRHASGCSPTTARPCAAPSSRGSASRCCRASS